MNTTTIYDFAIIGFGASGAHLALAMLEDPFFKDKSIIIVDEYIHKKIDKKWSFWSADEAVSFPFLQKWKKTNFISKTVDLQLDLNPYTYYTVDANDFKAYCLEKVQQHKQISVLDGKVLEANEQDEVVELITPQGNVKAAQVFDSRIAESYSQYTTGIKLLQHFKGVIIETQQPTFDASTFTMMDYRKPHSDSCSFMYVLPFSSQRALFEFTFFNHAVVDEQVYDQAITEYLKEQYPNCTYTIVETEQGVIPMTDYAFHKDSTNRITKIGTAGGWVKPSTGYSFHNSQKYAKEMVRRIKSGECLSRRMGKVKGSIYDTVFLEVLNHKNEWGPTLFSQMYSRNGITTMFRFLDEETTFLEELKIMLSFSPMPFNKAILRLIKRYIFGHPKSR